MPVIDCEAVFIRIYDKLIAAGRTTTEAGLAAQAAMAACLSQAVTPISQPTVLVPGTRLADLGPVKKRQ